MAFDVASLDLTRIQSLNVFSLKSSKSLNREMEKNVLAAYTVASLREKANSPASVSRLPSEILAHIFSYLSHSAKSADKKWDWICVTHVCSEWRSVALDCPLLWARLEYFKNTAMLEMFLNRAKDVPLEIMYNEVPDCPASFENLKLALRSSRRIRALEISILGSSTEYGRNALCEIIKRTLYFPAPHLKKLSFKISKGLPHLQFFPPAPFAKRAPQLKHFSVENCRISWNLNILKDLTSLHLKDLHVEDRPHLHTLLSILRRCPRIEDVMLDGIGSLRITNTLYETLKKDVVGLPRLRRFILASMALHDCLIFLDCLELCPTIDCSISCLSTNLSDLALPVPVFKLQEVDCENLIITIDLRSIAIEVLVRARNGCIFRTQACTNLIGTNDFIAKETTLKHIFESISADIEDCFWRKSKGLCIQIKNKAVKVPISENAWKTILGSVPNLRKLKCEFAEFYSSGHTEKQLMDVLNVTTRMLNPFDPIVYLCPNLAELEFVNAVFSQHSSRFHDCFLQFLSSRLLVPTHSIKMVKLTKPIGLSSDMVKDIRALVETVKWDGKGADYVSKDPNVMRTVQVEREGQSNRDNGMRILLFVFCLFLLVAMIIAIPVAIKIRTSYVQFGDA